jgi:hypothetical protein
MKLKLDNAILYGDKKISKSIPYHLYSKIQSFLGYPVIKARFKLKTGYKLNLKNPTTFNEKIVYNLLFNKHPLYPVVADKFAVREHVRTTIGEEYLIPLVDVVDSPDQLEFDRYPKSFIIKTNFTSGGNILVNDKLTVDQNQIVSELNRWLNKKYGVSKLLWFAQNMPRKIIVEELILDKKGGIPNDYKFFCFNNKVCFIQVDTSRFSNHARNMYTPDWDLLDVGYFDGKVKRAGVHIDRPKNLAQLIELAEKLSGPFTFMRIDLYSVDGRIFFGEFTPNPVNGNGRFVPESFDLELGRFWNIDTSLRK